MPKVRYQIREGPTLLCDVCKSVMTQETHKSRNISKGIRSEEMQFVEEKAQSLKEKEYSPWK